MADKRKELEQLRQRIDIALGHLDGKNVSTIADELETSRPTVRKWIARYEAQGVAGLLSRPPGGGRPREIGDDVREAIVRLPKETRPPTKEGRHGEGKDRVGEQWTAESLGEWLGVSASFVSDVWREARFNPPQHIQQVERNPGRMVRLYAELSMPAWAALNLQLTLWERNMTFDDYLLDLLADGRAWLYEDYRDHGDLYRLRERWRKWIESLPRADPNRDRPATTTLDALLRRQVDEDEDEPRPD